MEHYLTDYHHLRWLGRRTSDVLKEGHLVSRKENSWWLGGSFHPLEWHLRALTSRKDIWWLYWRIPNDFLEVPGCPGRTFHALEKKSEAGRVMFDFLKKEIQCRKKDIWLGWKLLGGLKDLTFSKRRYLVGQNDADVCTVRGNWISSLGDVQFDRKCLMTDKHF